MMEEDMEKRTAISETACAAISEAACAAAGEAVCAATDGAACAADGEREQEKTGLVIEGGGVRGLYAAGVLDVFMEQGIVFDGVVGVSAGAIHGCSYVSGQKGRSIRYYKKYCKDRRFMSFANVLVHGELVDTQFCYHDLPEKLDPYDYEAFDRSGIKFYAGCSNLETGRPECIQITDMKGQIDVLRASASLPFVSHTVTYRGMKLLDGGCTDSIPIREFLRLGYGKNVVLRTRHAGYVKKPEQFPLAFLRYGRYPRFVAALNKRYKTYNHTLEQIRRLERAGRAFVICPSRELTISRTCNDPDEMQEVYDLGRADAERVMGGLKEFLMMA